MIEKIQGKKILITAGPTYEPIDPVRYIGNHSTGRMGIALADYLHSLGAKVILVKGPGALKPINVLHQCISVQTAEQMYQACNHFFDTIDIGIFAAAVADYTPVEKSDIKIKKKGDTFFIQLKKTIDILATLGKRKRKNQFLVGFALETNNEIAHAKEKIQNKNLDIIVLNSLKDKGAGFKHKTNKISIIDKNNNIVKYKLKTKEEVSADIVKYLTEYIL